MNRFDFFNRPTAASSTTTTTAATTNDNSNTDPYDDRAPLSPRLNPSDNHTIQGSYSPDSNDLEAGLAAPPATAAAAAATPEMAERRTPNTRFLHRFRPAIPSFFSSVSSSTRRHQHQEEEHQEPLYGFSIRPSSSHYSGVGLRGAPDTVIDGGGADPVTPKSPEFRIGDRDLRLPGTRLHLPDLERTWTQGSNGPPTRPGTAGVAVPEPAVLRSRVRVRSRSEGGGEHAGSSSGDDEDDGTGTDRAQHRERRRTRRRPRREGERSGSGRSRRPERSGRSGMRSGRSRRSGRSERSGSHRSSRDDEGRSQRRARRERRRRAEGSSASSPSSSRGSRSSGRRPPPKHFLFCFPWIKSRRVRSQILRCFVSGTFLALTLSICE
ncbi:uncharacterized protein P884DRAFT_127168 [Thermothelomyces heterothallicus CBS 202.75]|uniref:uncharacterized protein n=1 Tax=Thermothelomyces heterothallicus CBS 202.75 TaxID=1149848 RepID=UPI0037432786